MFRFLVAVVTLGGLPAGPDVASGTTPLAFDGKTLDGWRTWDGRPVTRGWEVVDGAIHLEKTNPRAGFIVTAEEFGNFRLRFEWKIPTGGNSGVKYRVRKFLGNWLGCEYQICDDRHLASLPPRKLTGALYDLYRPSGMKKVHPPGEFNSSRIEVCGDSIEHWLNGKLIVSATVGDDQWYRHLSRSKFADAVGFGRNPKGRIMLTDHSSEVWYRNFVFEALPEPTVRRQPSFSRSGGMYAGGSDGAYGLLNTFRARVDGDCNNRLRAGRELGLTNVVQLEDGSRWRGDPHTAHEKLRRWLDRTDLALVDAVHFSEENPHNAASWLDPLFDLVKAADPELPVYVWPSYPLGPFGKSDGYIYDAYPATYDSFRKKVIKFLATGKPLIICVDGSGFSNLSTARQQLMLCHDFDLPVFYFTADSGSGSTNNWLGKPTAALAAWRNFVFSSIEFQRQAGGWMPMTSGDLVWGDVVELAGDQAGKVNHAWTGMGPATVYGFGRLLFKEETVTLKQNLDAALDYQFWSVFPVTNARFVLKCDAAEDGPAVSLVRVQWSRCGRAGDWVDVPGVRENGEVSFELGDIGRECRLRITLLGQDAGESNLVLRGGCLTGVTSLPADGAIPLEFYADGWRGGVRFRQELTAGLWRTVGKIDQPALLEPGSQLAIRGQSGHTVEAVVVEKFKSSRPLSNLRVRLTGYSHARLGSSFWVGVSLDGKHVLQTGSPDGEPREDGYYHGTHNLDLSDVPQLQDAAEFYVHLGQRNHSGNRTKISSRLELLEIDADTAN
jgi:hypothetical protein